MAALSPTAAEQAAAELEFHRLQKLEAGDEPAYEIDERCRMVQAALGRLPARECWVLNVRFFGGHTRDAMARDLGVSRERVRQLEFRALRRLQHPSYHLNEIY